MKLIESIRAILFAAILIACMLNLHWLLWACGLVLLYALIQWVLGLGDNQ